MTEFKKISLAIIYLAVTLCSCGGADYMPVYFPPNTPAEQQAVPSEVPERLCALSFTSQLCVKIKGDSIDVGTKTGDELCADVPAFPLHISDDEITILGSEFPDLKVEGHGLPAPITINARGKGDGASNTGKGTVDSSGNITIDNFSLFILAVGAVGEISDLTLTTGPTEELKHLPSISGSPPDASGALTLVAATTLGHTIDAADKYLKGASLTATFAGSITPSISQCQDSGQRSIEVKKIIILDDGSNTESPIPDGNKFEISGGTYIPQGALDVGPSYEASAKFKVKNIGKKPQTVKLPPVVGAFYLRSIDSLSQTLNPGQSILLNVTFAPSNKVRPGKISESIGIGTDQFYLTATALSKAANGAVSTIDDSGNEILPDVDGITLGQSAVAANTQRDFFLCRAVICNGQKMWSECGRCKDPSTEPCELLPVSAKGRPLGEVDKNCKQTDYGALPLVTIDLKGSSSAALAGKKQLLAIRNRGVADMKIIQIVLEEVKNSQSRGEFKIPPNAIFVSGNFADITKKIEKILKEGTSQGASLPVTLPPYQPGYNETTLYIVVTYTPGDLVGFDGRAAGVGSEAKDKAVLHIETDAGKMDTTVVATTTIEQTPPLELYFKTFTGTKRIGNGEAFALRGVTPATVDLAAPLFIKTSDTASSPLRITSILIDGKDAANFRWFDTQEKINSVKPASGKGLRCSIPVYDESANSVTSEIFDLKPVSLNPNGFDIVPGAYTTDSMPLFGCVDFHKEEADKNVKRLYEANLKITAQELTTNGVPVKNADGTFKEMNLNAKLLAAINPRSGKLVLRITQSVAMILNPSFPSLTSTSSREDILKRVSKERIKPGDQQVFTGAVILDPFDEMTITSPDGKNIVSKPNDGVTAVLRALDTHPVSDPYDDPLLFDYSYLSFDASQPAGSKGMYEDYPKVPSDLKSNGWRIYTSSLSYPGPIDSPEKRPELISDCEVINPCNPEGLKKFSDSGIAPGGKGACAFFYASGARFDSPAFHSAQEMQGGEHARLCDRMDKAQNLRDVNTGSYTVDGRITFEEMGLRFFGPTYFHNPNSPLGDFPPMDEIFHMAFTTGVLKPQTNPNEPNLLPDEKINIAKNEFKVNLTDKTASLPPICPNNTKNRVVGGRTISTWRYIGDLLFKDEEGKIPTGCPDEGFNFTGGQAYLRGRDMDPETGVVAFVAGAKFGQAKELSFAFQNTMMFIVLTGWLCDPEGSEDNFEGKYCFSPEFTEHDAIGQISIIK